MNINKKNIKIISNLVALSNGLEKGYLSNGAKDATHLLSLLNLEVTNTVTTYKLKVTENWYFQFKFCANMSNSNLINTLKSALRKFLTNMPTEFLFENLTVEKVSNLGFDRMNTASEKDLEDYKNDYAEKIRLFKKDISKFETKPIFHIPAWYASLIPQGTELYYPGAVYKNKNEKWVFFATKFGKHTGIFSCDVKNGTLFHGVSI